MENDSLYFRAGSKIIVRGILNDHYRALAPVVKTITVEPLTLWLGYHQLTTIVRPLKAVRAQ
jgi:hypothetical protein